MDVLTMNTQPDTSPPAGVKEETTVDNQSLNDKEGGNKRDWFKSRNNILLFFSIIFWIVGMVGTLFFKMDPAEQLAAFSFNTLSAISLFLIT
jgi:hypothetical protein